MPRKNTVNFMQIQHGLEQAIEQCKNTPEAPYASQQRPLLERVLTNLLDVTRRTDKTYGVWREFIKGRLLAAKHLSRHFEEVRDELGEYGVKARPVGRVGYWDHELLTDAVSELVICLGECADEAPEAPQWSDELTQLVRAFERTLREEKQAVEDYQRVAPLRRQVIYRAMTAVDEFQTVRSDYS